MPLVSLAGLIFGFLIASFNPDSVTFIGDAVDTFTGFLSTAAPVAIFMILAPALHRLFGLGSKSSLAVYGIQWFMKRRLLACVFAVIFTTIALGLPLFPESFSIDALIKVMTETMGTLFVALYTRPQFIAIWAAIAVAWISLRWKPGQDLLEKMATGFESLGGWFQVLVPVMMILVGAYLFSLPELMNEGLIEGGFSVEEVGKILAERSVSIFGIRFGLADPTSILLLYVAASLLVGLACMIWHLMMLVYTKYRIPGFSIRQYFKEYWVRVYPLLWATSSEAIATPLNLYLIKKIYPDLKREARRLAVGLGSYMNINGTTINVFILAGIVSLMVGFQPTFLDLLIVIPVAFLLGYGVAGIPGELVLYATPIAALMGVNGAQLALFSALYVTLQLGLPDSFRTGTNSTDNAPAALLINHYYEKSMGGVEEKGKTE